MMPPTKLLRLATSFGFILTFGERHRGLRKWPVVFVLLGYVNYSQTEQVKARAPVHLALDQFETMHLPFYSSITPRESHGSEYGSFVPLKAGSEAGQHCCLCILQPGRPRLCILFTKHASKLASDGCGGRNLGTSARDFFQVRNGFDRLLQQHPSGLPGRSGSCRSTSWQRTGANASWFWTVSDSPTCEHSLERRAVRLPTPRRARSRSAILLRRANPITAL